MARKSSVAEQDGVDTSVVVSPIPNLFWDLAIFQQRYILGAVFVLIFAVLGTLFLLLTHADTSAPSGALTLGHSKWCLDNAGDIIAEGNKVQLWSCNKATAQTWDFYENGTVHLHANTAYCLDNRYSSVHAGNIVWLWHCNGTGAQIWHIQKNSNGIVALINPHAHMCLDNTGNDKDTGNKIQIWPCWKNDAAQQWIIPTGTVTPPSPSPTAPIVRLSANPSNIVVNTSSTLTWSATNATSCTASGAWSGNKGISGTMTTAGLAASATYTLTCSGAGGSGSATTTVTVTSSTPPPTPPPPSTGFIQACGLYLCLNGQHFTIHGATTYGQLNTPADITNEVQLAVKAHLSLLEAVNFEAGKNLSDATSSATLTRVDGLIAAARQNGLHVLLNLSGYGHILEANGQIASTANWQNYLTTIMQHTNSITGIKYADDPTIAIIEVYGEIPPPPAGGTTSQLRSFFHNTLSELRALDPNHLLTAGGFSHINEANAAGIDWQATMADPNNNVCLVEVNSTGDRDVTLPMVSKYCKSLNKPWYLSAWSSCDGAPRFASDLDYWSNDQAKATHAQEMYNLAAGHPTSTSTPAMAGVGASFWNLGANEPFHAGTCGINDDPNHFSLTFQVIQKTAP